MIPLGKHAGEGMGISCMSRYNPASVRSFLPSSSIKQGKEGKKEETMVGGTSDCTKLSFYPAMPPSV